MDSAYGFLSVMFPVLRLVRSIATALSQRMDIPNAREVLYYLARFCYLVAVHQVLRYFDELSSSIKCKLNLRYIEDVCR